MNYQYKRKPAINSGFLYICDNNHENTNNMANLQQNSFIRFFKRLFCKHYHLKFIEQFGSGLRKFKCTNCEAVKYFDGKALTIQTGGETYEFWMKQFQIASDKLKELDKAVALTQSNKSYNSLLDEIKSYSLTPPIPSYIKGTSAAPTGKSIVGESGEEIISFERGKYGPKINGAYAEPDWTAIKKQHEGVGLKDVAEECFSLLSAKPYKTTTIQLGGNTATDYLIKVNPFSLYAEFSVPGGVDYKGCIITDLFPLFKEIVRYEAADLFYKRGNITIAGLLKNQQTADELYKLWTDKTV